MARKLHHPFSPSDGAGEAQCVSDQGEGHGMTAPNRQILGRSNRPKQSQNTSTWGCHPTTNRTIKNAIGFYPMCGGGAGVPVPGRAPTPGWHRRTVCWLDCRGRVRGRAGPAGRCRRQGAGEVRCPADSRPVSGAAQVRLQTFTELGPSRGPKQCQITGTDVWPTPPHPGECTPLTHKQDIPTVSEYMVCTAHAYVCSCVSPCSSRTSTVCVALEKTEHTDANTHPTYLHVAYCLVLGKVKVQNQAKRR